MGAFRTYHESDIFGFEDIEAKEELEDPQPDDEMPVKPFSVQWMMDTLARKKIGNRIAPSHAFLDQVVWGGKDNGAVRVRITSNLTILIERRISDLQGTPTWILKRVFKPKIRDYAGKEEFVASDAFEVAQELYFDELENTTDEYNVLNLVKRMSDRTRAQAPDLLLFQDIKEVKKNYYIIYFNLRAVGVGKLASRVRNITQTPEATIDVYWDKDRGLIHVILTTVSIGGQGDDWALDIPYLDAFFAPSQPKDEIIDTVLTTLKYF